jgi:uncharacterized protein (TIGR02391 family)
MIEDTKKILAEFSAKHSRELEGLSKTSERLLEACRKIERSWSGSFVGWHGRMYFRDFDIPSIYERFSGEWGGINGIPEGWDEKQPEEVKAKIESLVGGQFSADKFENEAKRLRKQAEALKSEVELVLGSSDAEFTGKENDLLKEIATLDFGKTIANLVNDGLPRTLMSRDTEALRQGTCIPSWLYYEAVASEGRIISESVAKFVGLVERLIRSIERKPTTSGSQKTTGLSPSLHPAIYEKCHELYEKKAYAEAVEKGFKIVRDRLRKLTGHETGSEAFGKGKLHIEGAAAMNVDQDFNEAVKFLTMAIDRFRNEKSHTSDAKIDDPIRAYEYLSLSSLAMHLLENTRIMP